MIVAGVADRVPDRVLHLIYFDSDVPGNGETSAPASKHAALSARARDLGDGWRVPAPAGFFHSQLAGQPVSSIDWFLARLVPQPLRTLLEPIHLAGGAASIPTTYLRCLAGYAPDDEDTRRQDARIRSEPSWRYRELDAPHLALVTHPAQAADSSSRPPRPHRDPSRARLTGPDTRLRGRAARSDYPARPWLLALPGNQVVAGMPRSGTTQPSRRW